MGRWHVLLPTLSFDLKGFDMAKFPTHKREVPNFLLSSMEVARKRMCNTIRAQEDDYIHAFPGNPVYPELAATLEKLQQRLAAQIIFTPEPRQSAAEQAMMYCEQAYSIRGMSPPLSGFPGAVGTCMPYRSEPPLRKTVHSTVLEQKQLT